MAENFYKKRGIFDEDRSGFAFREVFTPTREGPLPPRPHLPRSGKGGPSINQPYQQTGSVWSAADAAANGMTLSNGGLTVVPRGDLAYRTVRTSISQTVGKLYIEFKANALGELHTMWGLASSGANIVDNLGDTVYSCGIWANGPAQVSAGFVANYAMPGAPITPAANDVWALAVDFAAGKVWVAQNNVWVNSSSPSAGTLPMVSFTPATVGALFAGITLYGAGGTWTLQPTAASQKYAPPSGFSAWG